MLQRRGRRHPLLRIPFQASLQEINKQQIIAVLQRHLQILFARRFALFAAWRQPRAQVQLPIREGFDEAIARMAVGREEVDGTLRLGEQLLRWHAEQFDDAGQLIRFVLAGEERVAGVEFGENATERPHVDGHAVFEAEYHLGRTVEARLDVGVDALVFVAGGAEVDDLVAGDKQECGWFWVRKSWE